MRLLWSAPQLQPGPIEGLLCWRMQPSLAAPVHQHPGLHSAQKSMCAGHGGKHHTSHQADLKLTSSTLKPRWHRKATVGKKPSG